ncbi:flagellar biosynthesis repressor FlbT [Methylobacterium sp. DM1]|nr:flagellar biosynthesis repressor FlbT [Methylobacterium sp. DM1]
MAKLNQTRAFIRKGEIFFLNGALMRAHDSVNIEVMISDTFLMPSQIVLEDGLVSPLHKAYCFIKQMLIEPGFKGRWRNSLYVCLVNAPSDLREKVQEDEQAENLQKVLGTLRQEIKKIRESTELADGQQLG